MDQDHIRRLAAAVGLDLAPAHLPGVTANYQILAEFAAKVGEFPLDEMSENAAVFIPCSRTMQE